MKVRLDETLFKARAQENLSRTNDINKLEQVDALVECLDHFVADRKWVDEISRDELLTMVTQSNGDKEVLIESVLAKFNTPCIDTKKLKECKERRQNKGLKESMKKRKSLKESDNRDTFTLDTSNTPILDCGLYYTLLGELDPGRYDERFKEFEECVKECAKPILNELVRETPNFEVVSVGNYYHPRYYNYETDSLEFTVKYTGNDLGTVIEEYSNNQDFIDFLQNYKSYDGFISSFADNKEDFVKQDYVKSVSQIIKYNVTEEEYDEANENLYYDVMDCGFYPEDEDDTEESLKEGTNTSDWDLIRKARNFTQEQVLKALKGVVSTKMYNDIKNDYKIAKLRQLTKGEQEKVAKKLYGKEIKESLKEGYYGQTLQDFLDDCIDYSTIDKVYIYGNDDVVYEGPIDDIPEDMLDTEFLECDMYTNRKSVVTVNVDTSEEYGAGLYEFLNEFLDDCNCELVVIYDLAEGEEIFSGYKDDIPEEYLEYAFASYDAPEEMSVNLNDYEGEDDFDESLKESDDKEVEKLDTFDDQMDFLAKDEQEAIDGYKKVINKVRNAKVKSQLKKIETEEKAHKDYLNKVKKNKDLEYTEPLNEYIEPYYDGTHVHDWFYKFLKDNDIKVKKATNFSDYDEYSGVAGGHTFKIYSFKPTGVINSRPEGFISSIEIDGVKIPQSVSSDRGYKELWDETFFSVEDVVELCNNNLDIDKIYLGGGCWKDEWKKLLEPLRIDFDESLKECKINYNELLKDAYRILDNANISFNVEKNVFEFNDSDDAENAWKLFAKTYGKDKVHKYGLFKVELDIKGNLKEGKTNIPEKANLKKILDRYESNGRFAKQGNWKIARGGYDLAFQLYYDKLALLDGINDGFSRETRLELDQDTYGANDEYNVKDLANYVCQVYSDCKIEESLKEATGKKYFYDLTDDEKKEVLDVLTSIADFVKGDKEISTYLYKYNYQSGSTETTPISIWNESGEVSIMLDPEINSAIARKIINKIKKQFDTKELWVYYDKNDGSYPPEIVIKYLNDGKNENLEESDNLQTRATKMLSVKKYQIDLAWKNGKTWKTDPMTLDEISKSVGAKVTEKQFVDMMSDNIKSRKDAKNLTKAEIVKLYDYFDGKWKGKDVLWSIKGKTNETLIDCCGRKKASKRAK